MNGLPQLRLVLYLYPLWNAGWYFSVNREDSGVGCAAGFIAASFQWVTAAPRFSVCCISCGDICEIAESSTESLKQKAWTKGWLITEAGNAFCQFCKDDQEPNKHVKELICRRFGVERVKELNPNIEWGT